MTDAERRELAEAWIRLAYSAHQGDEEEYFWAFERMQDLREEDPEEVWAMIRLILSLNQDNPTVEQLSAGPLEDLLVDHGSEFIDRIENEAMTNSQFASLLGGVWKNAMSDEIWERVLKVRDRRGWDGQLN